jgi:hypothetical protein
MCLSATSQDDGIYALVKFFHAESRLLREVLYIGLRHSSWSDN